VLNGKLGFEPGDRRRIPHQHPHQRMDAQFDALDRVRRDVAKRQACVDHRMRDDTAWVRLVAILCELPRLAQAACDLIEVAPLRKYAGESALSLRSLLGARKAPRGQQSGHQAVARRVSHVPRLRHAAMCAGRARRLVCSNAKCPCGGRRVETKQLRARRGGAENAARRGDVPTRVVMLRRDGVADTAFDFDAEDERVQQLRAHCPRVLGERNHGGRHGNRGMDHRAQMRVVEIEYVGAQRVERCGIEYIHPLAAPEDGRLRPSGKIRERGQRRVDRLVPAAADRTARPIEQSALGLVVDLRRDRAPARFDDKARKLPGDTCSPRIIHGQTECLCLG
jgi:hypothetical protein